MTSRAIRLLDYAGATIAGANPGIAFSACWTPSPSPAESRPDPPDGRKALNGQQGAIRRERHVTVTPRPGDVADLLAPPIVPGQWPTISAGTCHDGSLDRGPGERLGHAIRRLSAASGRAGIAA